MTAAVSVGLAVLALSSAVSAALLLRARAARGAAVALALLAPSLLVAVVCWQPWRRVGVASLLIGFALCLPAVVLSYPKVCWREPVGFVAWVSVGAAGALVVSGEGSASSVLAGSLVIGVALVGHHLWRYERASDADRTSLSWVAFALCASGMAYGHSAFLMPQTPSRVVGLVLFACVPPSLVVGVGWPHLVDVRGLIVEALVLEVAVIAYVAVFVGATSLATLAGHDHMANGTLALVAAVVALGFHPLRVGLRAVIDELLFGNRPDPLDAATKVADRIGDDPALALTAVREAMVLPYASLVMGGEELASSGTPVPHTHRLSLALGDHTVGEVVVGLRAGDLHLSAADERVLRIVAPLLAQTLRARSLASELRSSRGQAIAAIEEERRRIRRDLHDGLGPTLSGIAFTADAARNSRHDPDAVDELLGALRSNVTSAIADIRRLVYGFRPPALDELGLLGAVQQAARSTRTADGRPLHVDVEAPDRLDELPAAVEVAAYRIAVEAITNAARHSGADTVHVRLERGDEHLRIDVRDGGCCAEPWTPGVGLRSMAERAAGIGGSVTCLATPDGGHVVAVLPLPARTSTDEPAASR